MMAACLATGTTQLVNARELEIVDLAARLSAMGQKFPGLAAMSLQQTGERLVPAEHPLWPIVVAGSYAMAVAMTAELV